MVNSDWMEQKIIQLENDRSQGEWSEIREKQLKYLITLFSSGAFVDYSSEKITEQLILIFHGT